MITIKLTNEERRRAIDLIKDNIPYAYGDDLASLGEVLTVVAKPDSEIRLTCLQWREIWEFIDDEDADEINISIATKIENAQSAYADAEDGVTV